jgi:hypothetical protein
MAETYNELSIVVREQAPCAAIAFKDREILGGVSARIQKRTVKGVIDFQDGKVIEVFRYALNRPDFFSEGIDSDLMAHAGNAFSISSF